MKLMFHVIENIWRGQCLYDQKLWPMWLIRIFLLS
jgi:hypothetical protein